MQKFKQSLAVKALAWVLAIAITVTMTPMPFAAFAEPGSPQEGIDQKVPFREKTYGVQVLPEGNGGPIRYNNVEVTKIDGSEIYLKLTFWPQGGAATSWGIDPAREAVAPYHGRYVISFDNPTFYQNIASFQTVTPNQAGGDTVWNSATGGRDWTMVLNNANLGAGVNGTNKSFDLKITLKNGATLESLGLGDTPISFTSAMIAGKGAKKDFNKIVYNTIDNSFIMANNANNPNPDENPNLYAPNGAASASGDGRFASSNFTTNGIGQNVYFDEATNSIVSRHTIAYPPQNFGQANYSWVLYIKEQVPQVLLPYIDTNSIKLGAMNDVAYPGQFKNSLNKPIDPIPVSIDENGLVDTSKVPAISITQTDNKPRSEQVKALGVARKNLSDKVFEGTLGQPKTYSIVYKLKDGVSKVDMAKALAQAAQQSKSHLLFESWLVSDFVNTPNGPLNGANPYADNGAEPKRLVNSYSNAYFDSYYDLSMANLMKPTVKGIQVEVDGTVDLSKGITGYVDDQGKAVTFDKGNEPTIEDITTEYKKNDDTYNAYDNTKVGNYTGRVRITYPDNSVEEVDVPVEVIAKKTDAEKNDPQGQAISAKVGDKVKAEDGIKNKDDLTNVKSYTFKEPVDTETAGEKDAVVVVEYNDGTKDEVAIKVNVAEADASAKPEVNQPYVGDETITGKGVVGATIVVKDENGDEIGTTTVKPDGTWEVTVPAAEPLVNGETITVTQTETGKTPSEETATVQEQDQPTKPTIEKPAAKNEPGKDSTTVTGKTTPNTEVTVTDENGDVIGTDTSDENGDFTIEVNPKQNPGTEVTITPKDGTPAKATVTEESASEKPTIDQPYVGDKAISGTGEPGEMLVVTDKDDNLIAEIRVDENGKWSVNVPTGKPLKKGDKITASQGADSVTATVKAKTSHGGSSGGGSVIPSKPEPKPDNGDLNKDDHYQYLIGYPDGTFAPNRGMTRAEVATMFTRLLKDRPVKGQSYAAGLSDIHAGDWYADTVGYAVQKGIVSGYPDGSFKPNQAITRAEFASIASRFAELTESKDLSFSDLDASYWGYKAIRLAASNGWISGYPDNTFRPEQAITRAEVTSITNRMLNRSADLDWINAHNDAVIHFSDVSAGDWFFEPVMEATMGHDFTRDKDGKAEHWTGLNNKTFI